VGAAASRRRGLATGERISLAARLFPAAFALHVLEEAPGFTDWARRHASQRYTQGDFVVNNALGFALTTAGTAAVTRFSSRPLFAAWYSAVLTQQALFNTAFHVGTTLAWREPSPGLASAVTTFLPLWSVVTRDALRTGRLTGRAVGVSIAIGGLVHCLAVTRQVFYAGH
jgi:hypothetical protein